VPRSSYTEAITPESEAEAITSFGDGAGVTVLAGGTILVPDVTYGRYPQGGRTLLLHGAGMGHVTGEQTVTIGAMATLDAVRAADIPALSTAAGAVADREIRGQATIGGNLCAPPGPEAPRGDLQAPLIALNARVRSTGAGGERTEPVEEFLANSPGRLVLCIEVDRPQAAVYITQRRPHTHSYSVMAIAAARADGATRVAAAGVGPRAIRLNAVEDAVNDGASAADAAAKAVDDADPQDDALASAWYRREVLPVLVTRALTQLQEG
jgi:CO/xanthine dehydrogenase FAD-binding subunit